MRGRTSLTDQFVEPTLEESALIHLCPLDRGQLSEQLFLFIVQFPGHIYDCLYVVRATGAFSVDPLKTFIADLKDLA